VCQTDRDQEDHPGGDGRSDDNEPIEVASAGGEVEEARENERGDCGRDASDFTDVEVQEAE